MHLIAFLTGWQRQHRSKPDVAIAGMELLLGRSQPQCSARGHAAGIAADV